MLFTRLDHSANIRTLVHLPNVCLVTVIALPNDTVPTHTSTLSARQVQSSRGNATTSLDLMHKPTLAIPLTGVPYADSRMQTDVITACTSARFARCDTYSQVKNVMTYTGRGH